MVIGIRDRVQEFAMSSVSGSGLNQLRIRHFKLIEALVGVGSLHKAAKAVHLSQPAASALLKEVEEALGTRLFDRTQKGVVLNAHGSAAVARIRAILGEIAMLSHDLQSARPLPVLRVGTLTHGFYGGLQRVLPKFLAQSNCRIDLRDSTGPNLVGLLESNQLDCLIARLPSVSADSLMKRGFFYQPLYQLEMCVLASASHPLARKRKLALRDLAAFPWVLQREGANSRYALMAAFASAGLPPPSVQLETSSFVFSLQLLTGSDWLTVVPTEAGLSQQRLGLAVMLPVKVPDLLTPVAFIAPRSAMTNPNVRLLAETVLRFMAPPAGSPVNDRLAIDRLSRIPSD